MTHSSPATLPSRYEALPRAADLAPQRERPLVIVPESGDRGGAPVGRPGRRPLPPLALPVGAFLLALVCLVLPEPARAPLAIVAGIGAPAWGLRRLLVAMTDLAAPLALALGLVGTLAGWALAEFLLLEARVPPSPVCSLGVVVVLLATPYIFLPDDLASRPSGSHRAGPPTAYVRAPSPRRHRPALVAVQCVIMAGAGAALLSTPTTSPVRGTVPWPAIRSSGSAWPR